MQIRFMMRCRCLGPNTFKAKQAWSAGITRKSTKEEFWRSSLFYACSCERVLLDWKKNFEGARRLKEGIKLVWLLWPYVPDLFKDLLSEGVMQGWGMVTCGKILSFPTIVFSNLFIHMPVLESSKTALFAWFAGIWLMWIWASCVLLCLWALSF